MGRGHGTARDWSLPESTAGLGRESGRGSVGMRTAARWMQQAAKLVASSEQRGWASGRELPVTCTAVSLRLLEKGPNCTPFWKEEQQARTHLFNTALMLATTTMQKLA